MAKTRQKRIPPPKKKHHPALKPPKPPSFWSKIWKVLKSGYIIIAAIFTILGWYYFTRDEVDKQTTTTQEQFAKEKFITGILLPPALLESNDLLTIECGSNTSIFPISKVRKGFDYYAEFVNCGISLAQSERLFDLKFKIFDKRLYVYAIFRDIENEQVVGEVNYKKWQLVKANTFKYIDSDESLEVFDMSGNVVFSLQYQHPNTVSVKGYYVSPSCIRVIGESIRPFNRNEDGSFDRQDVLAAITQIPRINK